MDTFGFAWSPRLIHTVTHTHTRALFDPGVGSGVGSRAAADVHLLTRSVVSSR